MTTYEDFEDMRDNGPVAYRAEIAIDLDHPDAGRLAEAWSATGDGEFRLALTGAIADFWEKEVRARGDDIPLSTAHGRDTGWIAVHQYVGMPYGDYFRGVEAIMAAI